MRARARGGTAPDADSRDWLGLCSRIIPIGSHDQFFKRAGVDIAAVSDDHHPFAFCRASQKTLRIGERRAVDETEVNTTLFRREEAHCTFDATAEMRPVI